MSVLNVGYHSSMECRTIPQVSLFPTARCTSPGLAAETLGNVLKYANIPYKLNGDCNTSSLVRGQLDTITDLFTFGDTFKLGNINITDVEWLMPVDQMQYGFVMRRVHHKWLTQPDALLDVFSSAVWCLIVVASTLILTLLLATGLAVTLFHDNVAPLQLHDAKRYVTEMTWTFFIKKNVRTRLQIPSDRLLLLCYGVLLLSFLPLYRSLVLGRLLHPDPQKSLVTSASQLASLINSGKVSVGIPIRDAGSYYLRFIENTHLSTHTVLQSALIDHPATIDTLPNLIEHVANDFNFVLITNQHDAKAMVTSEKYCHQLVFEPDHDKPPYFQTLIFSKKTRKKELETIQRIILGIDSTPFMTDLRDKYSYLPSNMKHFCASEQMVPDIPELTLRNLWSVFTIWVVGCSLSTIAFIWEAYPHLLRSLIERRQLKTAPVIWIPTTTSGNQVSRNGSLQALYQTDPHRGLQTTATSKI